MQTDLFSFPTSNEPQKVVQLEPAKQIVIVPVKVWWKKTDSKYSESGIEGGWEITKSPKGFPQINGGMQTPDMMVLFPTNQSVKDNFKYYEDWFNITVVVKLIIELDDRNQ